METSVIHGQQSGPHLLVSAGVHGDEFEPIRTVQVLAQTFEGNHERLQAGTLTLVPCVNERAFQLGQRCAEDGMDLARTCPGQSDGSVTEQAAAELSELIRSADYYIDLHTGGVAYELFPLAGYMLHSDRQVLDSQRKMAQAMNLPLVWGTSSQLEGRSLSVARDAGVPAIYCEHGGGSQVRTNAVNDYLTGVRRIMSQLGMARESPAAPSVRWNVEDDRPESGHLQVCNPSPLTGVFEPATRTGEIIRRGEALGTVYSLANTSAAVLSPCDGLVVMMRAFPRVLEGEALALVLPV